MTERYETNARKLPWPQDRGGITAKLQREGCRAIGRMGGRDDAYNVVMEVLRVLAKHAEGKLDQQKVGLEDKRLGAIRKQEQARAAKLGDIALQQKNIAKDMEHLQARKARLDDAAALVPSAQHTVKELPKTVTTQVAPINPGATVPVQSGPPTKARHLSDAASASGLGAPRMSS